MRDRDKLQSGRSALTTNSAPASIAAWQVVASSTVPTPIKRAVAKLLARLANGCDGVGRGHRDFNGDDAAGHQRFGERKDLFGLLRADDRDDARIGEQGNDFGFDRMSAKF